MFWWLYLLLNANGLQNTVGAKEQTKHHDQFSRISTKDFEELRTSEYLPVTKRSIAKGDRKRKSRELLKHKNTFNSSLENEDIGSLVGAMAWMSVVERVIGCNLLVVTPDSRHSFVHHVMRFSYAESQPFVLVDIKRHREEHSHHLLKAMWGEDNTICRAVLVDLTSGDDDLVLSFLDSHQITRWPEAWVVIVGSKSKVRDILYRGVFRNTLQPVYLGFKDSILRKLRNSLGGVTRRIGSKFVIGSQAPPLERRSEAASVYSRCLYCNHGDPHVRFLFLWPLGSRLPQYIDPFPDQHLDTLGHLFRVVSMPTFPYNARRLDSNETATTITLLDSLDKRLLETISAHLNFTYETRAPWDLKWGVPTPSGNFTGIVGTIQYNKADFTTTVAPTPSRNTVIDTTKAYHSDVLSVVSLKPQLLPQYLVIARPFTVDVWGFFVFCIMVWGFFLWLLQKIHFQFKKGEAMTFNRAIFYSWAVMLEDPPRNPPRNTTAQIMVGIWLVACLVITTGFRAALVSHLAVQLKTKPIDSFRDLVAQGGFGWGMEARYLTGVSRIYFETTTDPVVKHVYKYLEQPLDHQTAFDKIAKGKYGFVCFEKLASTLIDSYYTDDVGNTPFYISKEGYSIVPYFGWGYGKGAPFRDRFNMVMNRINEAGILEFWTDDVMARKVKENRKALRKDSSKKSSTKVPKKEDQTTVQLRMVHMTGVFLVLFLGFGISFVALFVERSTTILKKNL